MKRPAALALELLAAAAILTLAGYVRFRQLQTNPGWYSDEGTQADIANHLTHGVVQYQALNDSTLLVVRFPVVPSIVAALMPVVGDAMKTLRSVTAALGVISVAALYLVTRSMVGRQRAGLALLSAGLLAVYPPAVFYSRIGFSYNLLTPLLIVVAGGLWRYVDRGQARGALIAAGAVGIGAVTDLMMVTVLIAAGLLVLIRNWRQLLWWLPLSLAPLALYLLSLALRHPQALQFDLQYLAARAAAVPWWAQLGLIVLNLGSLLLSEVWWIPAIVGLAMLRPRRLGLFMLFLLLVPLALLSRSVGVAWLRLYSISPLFPLVALGVASLLWRGVPWLLSISRSAIDAQLLRFSWLADSSSGRWIERRLVALGSAALVFMLALTPLLISTWQLLGEVQRGFVRGDSWAYVPVAPARQAIQLVNRQLETDDLVLASPAIAWAIQGQSADFQQLLAYSGEQAIDYPANLSESRFAFAVSLDRARYAIVDRIWREWGANHLAPVERALQQIERWPLVWESNGIEVYENPARSSGR